MTPGEPEQFPEELGTTSEVRRGEGCVGKVRKPRKCGSSGGICSTLLNHPNVYRVVDGY